MRKGQSAFEYLMTYGWAILIVVVVAGVLAYYGVFNPGKLIGVGKVGFSQVDVVQPWSFSAGGNLSLIIENRVGKSINITDIYVQNVLSGTFVSGVVRNSSGIPVSLASGAQSGVITIPTGDTVASGTNYQLNVYVQFYVLTAPGIVINSTGSLTGLRG